MAFILSLCIGLFGCALSPNVGGGKERVFFASREHVWQVTQLVLQDYPLQVSSFDEGLVETKQIRGEWVPPHQKQKKKLHGFRYRLRVHVIERDLDKRVATKVIVYKEVILQKDFFSAPETLSSDGLEETVILYRIARELQINKIIERVQDSQS